MKKLYALILSLIITSQLHAQVYYPMLDSISNNWYYVSTAVPVRTVAASPDCDYLNASFNFSTSKMFTAGDTVINSLVYKKLEQEQQMVSGSDCFFGFLREDTTTQKIYFQDNLSSSEILLYDFSMQVGDSIYYDFVVPGGYYTSGYFKVDSISTVTILAGPRRIFYLRNYAVPWSLQYPMEWIEGVGHPGHVVLTHSGNTSYGGLFWNCTDYLIRDFYQSLSCFEHNSQKVFFDSCAHAQALNNWCFFYADSCNFWNICGSLSENGVIQEFKIAPNPATESVGLSIEANRNTSAMLELYDIRGRLIFSKPFEIRLGNNEEQLNMENFEAGSYLVILKFDTGVLYRKLVRTP